VCTSSKVQNTDHFSAACGPDLTMLMPLGDGTEHPHIKLTLFVHYFVQLVRDNREPHQIV
jgi:hypothetical protein